MRWRALLLGMLVLAAPAWADELGEALSLPVAGALTGALDVPRFAWVENAAGVRNIWVASAGKAARRVTDFTEDDGQLVYDLALSGDGRSLAFVRGGDEEFPDDAVPNAGSAAVAPKQQVFVSMGEAAPVLVGDGHGPVFSADGGRLAFTRKGEIWVWERGAAIRVATVAGEVTRLTWSPDGARLLFVDNRGDHSFVGVLEVGADRVRYLDPGLGFSVEPVWSPDGRSVAFIRLVEPPAGAGAESGPYWSLRAVDIASGVARVVWRAPAGQGGRYAGTRSRNLFWSADGELVFPWERSGWLHAYAVPVAGGNARELTPGAYEVESFLLGRDGRSLVYAANTASLEQRQLWRRALAGDKAEPLTPGEEIAFFPTLGGDAIAAVVSDAIHPAHAALVGKTLVPLGAVAVAKGFVAPEAVVFRAEDGVEVHAQLFRARTPGRHPALVFVHGGPKRQMLLGFHPMGYYSNAYVLNQHFAAEGYDVLAVNYRSGTGYGLAFRDAAGIAREGASEYRDVLAAGRWLAAQPQVDPGRIAIWGGSWGGYLTALALARNSDLFAAGVDFHGVHSMLRPVENTLSPDAQAAARALQWSSSPMGAIETWKSPVLLVHGDDDKSVDFFQSLLLARVLAARGVSYRELVLPNERHEFLRYADWLAGYRAADAFLAETLKGKTR